MRKILQRTFVALTLGALAATAALGQEYPDKPLTFVVPFAPGTAADLLARTLGKAITAETGQSVIVDNKPGAGGIIAAQTVARARPDGYTALIGSNTTHAAAPYLYKALPYDPEKDFSPVTTTGRGAQILVVRPGLPATSVAELIKLAGSGSLTFGSGSASSRVAGELFQQMANIKILHVPYKSNTLALTDVMAGQVDIMFTDSSTGIPVVQSGKLKALGVTATRRVAGLPDTPTISEAGLKGYEMTYWSGAWLPANTPAAIVKRLNTLIVGAVHAPASAEYFKNSATELFTMSSDEFSKFQRAELTRWGALIRAANIQPE